MWIEVGCPCSPARNDIVTPRHLFVCNLKSFFSFSFLAGAGSQRPSIVGARNFSTSSVYFSAVTAMLTMSRSAETQPRQRGSVGSVISGGGVGGGEDRKGSVASGSGSNRSRASSSVGLVSGPSGGGAGEGRVIMSNDNNDSSNNDE